MDEKNGPGPGTDTMPPAESWSNSPLSRRRFIKIAAVGTAGGLTLGSSLLGCMVRVTGDKLIASEAATILPRPALGYIARVSIEESSCASCGLCTLVCAAVHGKVIGWSCSGIWLDRDPFRCVYDSLTCRQCDAPECFFACQAEGGGALYIDQRTGARAIDASRCLGCGACRDACVFSPPRIVLDQEINTAFKCDLCSGRPEGPACVEFCPHQALKLQREA